jgi:alkylhydroperoxidase family enzyme
MELPIHSRDDAPVASRPILEGIAADLGLVPNLAGTAAGSPALLAGFDSLRRAVAGAGIDPLLREVTGLAVGVAVDNRYGIAFHSTMLANLGLPEPEIAAIRAGEAPSDPAGAAVHAFAVEAAEQRGKVDDATVAQVRAAGLDDEAILEILLEVAFACTVGLIDNLVGHVELDAFLQPRARHLRRSGTGDGEWTRALSETWS